LTRADVAECGICSHENNQGKSDARHRLCPRTSASASMRYRAQVRQKAALVHFCEVAADTV
jgi:hypothetical protein